MNPFNVILWYYEILINTGMCATGTPPLKINMSIPPTGGVCRRKQALFTNSCGVVKA